MDSQVLSFITRLWPRSLTVIDEQKGLMFSLLELAEDQGEPQAKILADRTRASLTPDQVKQVAALKKQLVRQN